MNEIKLTQIIPLLIKYWTKHKDNIKQIWVLLQPIILDIAQDLQKKQPPEESKQLENKE